MPTDLNAQTIADAHKRISRQIRRTPVIEIATNELGNHPPLSLKLELLQHSGSFKARGAFNNLLSRDVPSAGVTAASGGNHGAAVAFAAKQLGIPAAIFVPEISSPKKIARIEGYGANVTVSGANYADALALCEAHMAASGAIGIHAYEAVETMAGQGTVAKEWEEQAGPLDVVLVAVGGGGLIGGMAHWLGDRTTTVAVETEGTPAYHHARKACAPVDVEVGGLAADSLGARQIGTLAFEALQQTDAPSILITDDDIRHAQSVLWNKLQIIAEPGGAAALAALLSGAYEPPSKARIGVLVCGANTDPGTIA